MGDDRKPLVRGVVAAFVLLCVVVSVVVAAYVGVSPSIFSPRAYGVRQAAVRRSSSGRLETSLRVVAGADGYGVVARRYEGGSPGPTLVVDPGDALVVVLENRLGDEAGGAARARKSLMHPNTTSLHAHGFHVSPREDDVFTLVAPGDRKAYRYALPGDHPPGTYWYHPHAQGSSSLQAAGMFGAVIIRDRDPDRFPEDVVLLLSQTNLVAGKARNYAWASAASGSRLPVVLGEAAPADTRDAAALAASLAPPLDASFWTVNGELAPTLTPPAGAWLRWRLVNAGTNDVLALELDGGDCETMLVARDGVALAEPRRGVLASSPLVLAPGSRADVFARCASKGALVSRKREDLEYYLGAASDVFDGPLLTVAPASAKKIRAPKPATPPALDAPSPRLFAPLLDAAPDRAATLAFYEGADPVTRDGNSYSDYGLRVVDGDAAVQVGDLVEWTIRNDRKGDGSPQGTNHPFHLHTNHFQIVALSHGRGVDYDVGDWRDTITMPTPGNVTLRFRAADYDGPSLAHCHIFSHADLGMEHKFTILPGEASPPPG